ncbi:MAG: esterase/lipase family protein [Candidatus Limnocylindrales bacterium]
MTVTNGDRRALDGAAAWLGRSDSISPTVLVLGGFLTAPPLYRSLVRRLVVRGAAGAVVADVWTPDWLLAGLRGIGPICSRSAKALREAVRLSAEVSAGAPLLVVGHSAGGITGRLLTAPEPIDGRKFAASRRIGAIVTLGTPHRLSGGAGIGRRINAVATSVADAHVPGAFFAPDVGYLSVASRAIRSNTSGTGRERVAHLLYRSVIGRAAVPGTEGDGQVPVVATELAGARRIVLESAIHGPGAGARWYGSEGVVDEWWPVALETWHSALRSREAAHPAPDLGVEEAV